MTRGRGRPTIGTPVQIRLPAELLDQLDTWADEHDVTRAEAVRQLVGLAIALDQIATPANGPAPLVGARPPLHDNTGRCRHADDHRS